MKRPIAVSLMLAALLASGCATQPAVFIPPGEDRNMLAEAIAQNGRSASVPGDVVPDKPDPVTRVLVGTVKLTGKVAATGLVLALLAGVAYCHGHPNCGGLYEGLYHLWVDD